jgi:thymidylate synthase
MEHNIPVLKIEAENLPSAWEQAVMLCWEKGISIKTEYDKPEDPASKDCTMIVVVQDPFSEPRIHKGFPGGLEDLEIYLQEVVLGVHDHWINPDEGMWTYTYHKRLFGFENELKTKTVDQIAYIVDKLVEAGYSRRAQAITWNVMTDPPTTDPPCLQRVWCRVIQHDGKLFLNMNTHWRSRDAFKAAYMNMFALTGLQRYIAEEISQRIRKNVLIGRYVDISDSFHVYGSYFEDFKKFIELQNSKTFEQRTWDSSFAKPMFDEAKEKLANDPDFQRSK